MSIHHAPPPRSSARDSAAHPDEGWDHDAWDDEWDDAGYDDAPVGRVLWGRVAAFCLALLLAFLAGRMTAGNGDAVALEEAQAQAEELRAELAQARNEIDALAAGGADAAAEQPDEAAAGGEVDAAEGAEQDAQADADPADAAADADAADGDSAEDAAAAEEPAAETYEVQPGDNLFGLAERFYGDGQQWRLIAEANGLGAGAVLSPGQTLDIPEA